ncbi:MAG: cobalamin B12-binding domain-containing protein [Pseudomonadota bacterium]
MDGRDILETSDTGHSPGRDLRLTTGSVPSGALGALTDELIRRIAKTVPDKSNIRAPEVLSPASKQDIDAFCDALIAQDPNASVDFFDDLRKRGETADALSITWIAATARELGERWVADQCSFLDVTVASARLHAMHRKMRGEFVPPSLYQPPELSALFAPVPGETHVLGITMAADFFRRAGWRVDLCCEPDLDALLEAAAVGDYRLIGLSAGCVSAIDGLETAVQHLRDADPDVKIVLGGYITELEPDIKQQVRVDHIVSDVVNAPLVCQHLVLPDLGITGDIYR